MPNTVIRIGLPGERAADAKPVTLAILDGWQAARREYWSKPSHPSWSTSIPTPKKSSALYLPEGDHVFRVAFHQRRFRQQFKTEKEAYNTKKNKYIGSCSCSSARIPSKVEKASRKKILICDPNTGGELASTRSSRLWPIAPTAVR